MRAFDQVDPWIRDTTSFYDFPWTLIMQTRFTLTVSEIAVLLEHARSHQNAIAIVIFTLKWPFKDEVKMFPKKKAVLL